MILFVVFNLANKAGLTSWGNMTLEGTPPKSNSEVRELEEFIKRIAQEETDIEIFNLVLTDWKVLSD